MQLPRNSLLTASTGKNETIISTTFGSLIPKETGGSITVIGQEDFNKGFIHDPAGLVAGRIPGLQITAADGSPFTQYDIRSLRSSAVQFPLVASDCCR